MMLWTDFHQPCKRCMTVLVAYVRNCTISLCPVIAINSLVVNPAVELWKAGIPLKGIREQLNISERYLRRVWKSAKENPLGTIAATKPKREQLFKILTCHHEGLEKEAARQPHPHSSQEADTADS